MAIKSAIESEKWKYFSNYFIVFARFNILNMHHQYDKYKYVQYDDCVAALSLS